MTKKKRKKKNNRDQKKILKNPPKANKKITATTSKSEPSNEKESGIITFIKAYINWTQNNFKLIIIFYIFLFLIFLRNIIKPKDWMVIGDLFQSYLTFLPSWIEIALVFKISSFLSIFIVFPYLLIKCFKDINNGYEAKKVFLDKINFSLIVFPIGVTTFVLSAKNWYEIFQNGDYLWAVIIIFLAEIIIQLGILIVILMQIEKFETIFNKYKHLIPFFKNIN